MRFIDLTHTIANRMQVYPGEDPPMLYQSHIIDFDGYSNFQITMGMHIGTHIDGPLHMVQDPTMVSDVPLESLIGKGCIIDISNIENFSDYNLVKEKAEGCSILLFYTGYGAYFNTLKYVTDYPVIDEKVAQTIVDIGIKMIGIDTFSPDEPPYNTHKILLSNKVLIAENLTNLDQLLPVKEFTILALPLKIKADSAPARIIAML
jgi:kynurenine formamidase